MTTNKEILQKHFTAEFGHEGHGEFMSYILNAMNESNLRTELSFLYQYSERIGLDAESRIEEITSVLLAENINYPQNY